MLFDIFSQTILKMNLWFVRKEEKKGEKFFKWQQTEFFQHAPFAMWLQYPWNRGSFSKILQKMVKGRLIIKNISNGSLHHLKPAS